MTKALRAAFLISISGFFFLQAAVESPARADDETPAQSTSPPHPAKGPSVYTPLTQAERFHRYVDSTFSVEAAVRAAAGAAIAQATNTPSEWGQGAAGYTTRIASGYGQHVIRQTLAFGAADLLDEDNRYLASGLSGAKPRLRYAIASTFLARRSNGHRRISYSRLGSVVATAFISREWQPHSIDGAQNAEWNILTVLGTQVGFNIAREFLPRIFHTQQR